jgi:hypothetical protein
MSFGLTGAFSIFQHYINDSLKEYLNIFYIVYLDDVLIYSDLLEDYRKHVKLILRVL